MLWQGGHSSQTALDESVRHALMHHEEEDCSKCWPHGLEQAQAAPLEQQEERLLSLLPQAPSGLLGKLWREITAKRLLEDHDCWGCDICHPGALDNDEMADKMAEMAAEFGQPTYNPYADRAS